MGIFKQKTTDEVEAKAVAAAEKKGVNTKDAVAVAHEPQPGKAGVCTMVVRGDRVEVVSHGKPGALSKRGTGGGMLLAKSITGATVTKERVYCLLTVSALGETLQFHAREDTAYRLRDAILSIAS